MVRAAPLLLALGPFASLLAAASDAIRPPSSLSDFLEAHCVDCHGPESRKAGLDLTATGFDLADAKTYALWVKVHDKVGSGAMPPKKKTERPPANAQRAFLSGVSNELVASDLRVEKEGGRAVLRRMNRLEYENALRELLGAPWLSVKDMLPDDGEASLFSKSGGALDMSHVQLSQTLAAADAALRQVLTARAKAPETKTARYWAREQPSFTNKIQFNEFNRSPERATFPVLGNEGQPLIRAGKQAVTVGSNDPAVREIEGMGVVASSYEPIEPRFDRFSAPFSGRYRIRMNAHSVWVGPGKGPRWWVPNLDVVSAGRRDEPVIVQAAANRVIRRIGAFDATPEPQTAEFDAFLFKRESIRIDAARFFRSRPPNYRNPLAEEDGQPGVSFRWLEVEGPFYDVWPPAGQTLLFGSLPIKPTKDLNAQPEFVAKDADAESERLLRGFLEAAYRRPLRDGETEAFVELARKARQAGQSFTESMLAAYGAALVSPGFLLLEEKPGRLDDAALATRLAAFLWNGPPDAELRELAANGRLGDPRTLRAQTERLLSDPRCARFIDSFLDQWLDLRKIDATTPDAGLYPDYYLDDLLVESSVEETRAYFRELLERDLGVRFLVDSDFAFLNERLATHYGIEDVKGVALRKVKLPRDTVRGGLLTQASVLKVTANGTTTSPVLRGVWIMERLLGDKPPAPPPGVPAVEPDIRGATTIREQLDLHRKVESCASCHVVIDPPGLALESFDVFGGFRERYRALGNLAGNEKARGWGKNGQPFAFHEALPVDASGFWPDGTSFADVSGLRRILLSDPRRLARALTKHLITVATGTPVRFGDRERLEKILDASRSPWGVRSLVHAVVQSDLFRTK